LPVSGKGAVLGRVLKVFNEQAGRITACTACEESQSVATASSNGSLHVWRVEYTTRPGGTPDRYTGTSGTLLLFSRSHWNQLPERLGSDMLRSAMKLMVELQ
jgi:hypothetical protein